MRSICILGCGWLGLPLAKSLLTRGFSVRGSTTSQNKIPSLSDSGIIPFQIEISEKEISGDLKSFLEDAEILIIDIPPKLRTVSSENFVKKIQNLIPFIKKSTIKNVIFISSTAVYNDNYSTVTEVTPTQPETESGKQLLQAEKLFLPYMFNFGTTIIRFGGLIGEDRHPVYHLAGRQNLENPGAAINLIHQMDCIGIIEKVIALDCWNQTLNAVAPFHPSRKDYYSQKATELGLPLPEFNNEPTSFGKIIHANMVESDLQYTFQKPNL